MKAVAAIARIGCLCILALAGKTIIGFQAIAVSCDKDYPAVLKDETLTILFYFFASQASIIARKTMP